MVGSRQRPVRNRIAVHVLVAGKSAQTVQVFLGKHLAAVQRLFRIGERLGHPVVHAQIEIGENEDRRLQSLGEIEGLLRELVALFDRAGQQHHVLGIAMRQESDRQHVALHGAGGHAGRRPDALDVEDHTRQFGVIAQTGKLRHERNARPGGRRHRAGASPAGAEDHADRGQLILRLHNGEGRLAVLFNPVFPQVLDQILDHRRGRRDGIPGHDRDAGEHCAQRGRRIAVDDDLAFGRMHPLEHEGILFRQRLRRELVAGLDRVPVQIRGLLLAGKLAAHGSFDALPYRCRPAARPRPRKPCS